MASSAPPSNAPVGPLTAPVPDGAGRTPTGSDRPRDRHLGRRPALPGGRAVVGGLLVTLAALGTYVAYTAASAGPTATVVVADRPLAVGETLGPADLRSVAVDVPEAVQATLFASAEALDGAVVLAPIDADQAVPRSAVSATPADDAPRSHDLSFALDRERALNGRLRAGDRIDLVATFGTGDGATTEIVARSIRVIGVDAPTSAGVGAGAKVTLTVALEAEADVLLVANALEVAQVTLVRSTGATPAPPAADGPTTAPGDAQVPGSPDTQGTSTDGPDREGTSGSAPAAVRDGAQP